MASREKALCDKIIATSGIFLRSKKQVPDSLLEDVPISENEPRTLNTDLLEEWAPKAQKNIGIEMLIKALKSIQD